MAVFLPEGGLTGMMYADVILPLPLTATFTYAVPEVMAGSLRRGHRVLVPFGKKKIYTGIVASTGAVKPEGYEVKEILQMLDADPILRRPQIELWEWIAEYYLCSVGEVFKAALPAGLKVESETYIELNPDYEYVPGTELSEREAVVLQYLDHAGKRLSIADIEKETGLSRVSALAGRLLERGAVIISEKLNERYRSKKINYVRLNVGTDVSSSVHAAFDAVKGAQKQEKALLALVDLSGILRQGDSPVREVTQTELLERSGVTQPILAAMARKRLISIYSKDVNRFNFGGLTTGQLPVLSEAQGRALKAVHTSWLTQNITLLHGVTSSGKTEIYMHLIDYVLRQGRQVLYLVPEIALTTQLTHRMQQVFGDKVVIYHSKFSDNERVDIWKRMLASTEPCVVIGTRSSIFLPFASLGLVIVDEEHEPSYKQQDPAPRYNARDTAMVLARRHGAKTLLGSATPAVDTYYKAVSGRYGMVTLSERYGEAKLPEITIVDTLKARKRGLMQGIFARDTKDIVDRALADGKQAIMFLNRRGYAPVAECKQCAYTPKCEHCDVTLTYHKHIDKLVCHYCGAIYPLPRVCPACKEPAMDVYGYGTERIEDDVAKCFPGIPAARMDLDTTRNKDGYERIINEFSSGKKRILVGTQMVTKGLDFGGVEAVAVLNADSLLNMPDFRASERVFNMLEQVSGRAGRRDGKGLVAIQTRQPEHPLFKYLLAHDYEGYYSEELEARRQFAYPPFTRVIYIYLRHRDRNVLDELAVAYGRRLRQLFGNRVFGPEEPMVSRVQTLYIRKLMLKVEVEASMAKVKSILRDTYVEMMNSGMPAVRGAIVTYDVDPM
ncbi:MAG: primosomal protein N' [Muribaculaceae bacterium]|nr:primosomal protein N' [Muribaculaceae bacterium]